MIPLFERLSQRAARIISFTAVVSILCGVAACNSMKVHPADSSVKQGGMTFKILGYSIEQPNIVERKRILEYKSPFLAIKLQIKNAGKRPFVYSPTHFSKELTQISTPLLFPKPDKAKPPFNDIEPLSGVYIEEGTIASQKTSPKTLKSGESVQDIYLFKLPDFEKGRLVLSLPPSMHRGTRPVFFEIPYTYKKPPTPQVHKSGGWIAQNEFEFQLVGTDVAYIELEDQVQGKAYSSEPLLKVTYKIKNTGKDKKTYNPTFRRVRNMPGPTMVTPEGRELKRVDFPITAKPVGQIFKETKIESGQTLTDFSLFERPDIDKKEATFRFLYPTTHLDMSRLMRFDTDVQLEEPKPPEGIRNRLNSK